MTSSYDNDLRLNEMATGDQSGAWGTVTNLNLEMIAEAFSYGTRVIADAPSDNITLTDGALDADRSMYLRLSGGGQACTVTFVPATISKVWLIENATSATLTMKQGSSPAGIAIPAGQVKMIATDGGGSTNGVVYDLLTDVNLAGTTVMGDIAVGGKVITMTGSSGDTATLTVAADGALAIATTDAAAAAANISITADGTFTAAGTTITLDSAGDIILDADGANVIFKDDGTSIGTITNASSDLVIKSNVQDKDILLKGDDDGTEITALSLDMSEGGNALFSGTVTRDLTRGSLDVGNSSGVSAPLAAGGADTVLTSDGTDLSWVAAGGAFMGEVVNVTSSGETTLTAAQSGSLVVITNAAASVKLPTSAAGLFFGLRNTTTTSIPIRGQTGGVFINSILAPVGIAETDGFAIIVGIDSTHWAADYQVATANIVTKFVNSTNSQTYSVPLTIDSTTTAIYIAIMSGCAEVGYGGTGTPPTYTNPGQPGSGFGETLITSNLPTTLTVAGAYAVASAASTGYGTAGRMTVTNSGGTTVNIVAQPAYGATNYQYTANSVQFIGGTVTGAMFNASGGQGRSYIGGTSNPYYNNSNGRYPGGGGSGSTAGVGGRPANVDATAGTLKTDTGGAWAPQYTGQNGRHGGGTGGNDGTATAGGAAGSKDSNSMTLTPYLGKEFYIPPGHVNPRPTSEGYDSGTFFGVASGYGGTGASFGRAPSDLINIQGAGNRPLFDNQTGGRGGRAFYSAGRLNPQCTIIQFKG